MEDILKNIIEHIKIISTHIKENSVKKNTTQYQQKINEVTIIEKEISAIVKKIKNHDNSLVLCEQFIYLNLLIDQIIWHNQEIINLTIQTTHIYPSYKRLSTIFEEAGNDY